MDNWRKETGIFPFVPDDADIGGLGELRTLNPKDKFDRQVGFSAADRPFWSAVCERGAEQLISCYRYDDNAFTRDAFMEMCRHCPHSTFIETRFDTIRSSGLILPVEQSSITEPYFILKRYKNNVCDPAVAHAYVYFISDGEYVKIGAANNPVNRLSDLQVANSRKLELLCVIPVKDRESCIDLESRLHGVYRIRKVRGEWYDILKLIDLDSFKSVFPANVFNQDDDFEDSDEFMEVS